MYQANYYGAGMPPFCGEHAWLWLFGPFAPLIVLLIVLLAVWSIAWKGIALWKSARHGSKVWFVVLLIVNTVGILDILYIYLFSKKRASAESK